MDFPVRARWCAVVFLVSFTFVWWLAGDRLVLINDEGTFLSQAARILNGEVLYRDLFGLTGPLSYYTLALAFKLFGISLATAHLVLAVQIATITTLIFFVARELGELEAAFAVAFIFLAMNVSDPQMMANNHRWDADTYAIAGVVAVWRRRPFIGGFLLACSVWATPILAITAVTVCFAAWLIRVSPIRVASGGAAGAAIGVGALSAIGAFSGLMLDLLWAQENYSGVNRMHYGEIIGGYPALFEGTSSPVEWALRAFIVFGITLPAWLPPLTGLLVASNRDRNLVYFFICGSAMIASVAPRFDIGHLIFAAPLFYPIAARFLQRARWTMLPVGCVAFLFLFSAVVNRAALEFVDTPVGRLRTDGPTAAMVRWVISNVKPGEKMFVYPYPPIFYFLTEGRNVSRYALLHPGMFTQADEIRATMDIQAQPPAKVLYLDIAPEQFLRLFPSSDPSKLKLSILHNYVVKNFEPAGQFQNLHLYTPPKPAKTATRWHGY